MDIKEYKLKQLKRASELLKIEPKDEIEQAIIHLEILICDISPYGRAWRSGYVKSLKMAIKVLDKERYFKYLLNKKKGE